MGRIEVLILQGLLFNEEYTRRVLPFLKNDYFSVESERILFNVIRVYVEKYNALPTPGALTVIVNKETRLNEDQVKELHELIALLEVENTVQTEWLIDQTEVFCKDRALFNAIYKSVRIAEGKDGKGSADSIPSILQDALSVSFDTSVGHDYLGGGEGRYDFYVRKEERVPFGLEKLNHITGGGISRKTLTVIMARVGVGKSLFMCDHAASCLMAGKNVLYITLEMAEERIAERIDANILDVPLNMLEDLPRAIFIEKLSEASQKTKGRLFIKEYPTASANVGHFRALFRELEIKKNFKPDIVFVDYINLCSSTRVSSENSYLFIKSVAEELRGLAVECNVPIVTATQINRAGAKSSDADLTDVAESWGLPATSDLFFVIMQTEELEGLGQYLVKQLKNRYEDPALLRRFYIGVDKSKMRLYDIEDKHQPDPEDDHQTRPTTTPTIKRFFEEDETPAVKASKIDRFSDFAFEDENA